MEFERGLYQEELSHTVTVRNIFSDDILHRIRKLYGKNNWYNWFSIIFDWLIIALSILLVKIFPFFWVYIISIIFIGSRMRGFDNLMHEASHGMLFKNRTLNKWGACILVAFPVFTSFTAYRNSHFDHHKFLWDPEKDPDARRYHLVGLDKPQKDIKMFVINHILKPVLLFHVPRYIKGTIKVNILIKEVPLIERMVRMGFWIFVFTSTYIFNLWLDLFLFWVVPYFSTFQLIRYWAEMAEHSGLKTNHPLYSSRNTFGNFFERFFLHPHHDNFHLVHHLFPAVPHYHLKKIHSILMENEEYRTAHQCVGFFRPIIPGYYSVIDDICGKRWFKNTRYNKL